MLRAFLIFSGVLLSVVASARAEFDLLLRGGRVIDATGYRAVYVNGVAVVENDTHLKTRPGKVVRRAE